MRRDVSGWTTRLRQQDIARYTQAGAWRNVTLADCAQRRAQVGPERVAVVEGSRVSTFGEVLVEAQRLANAFVALGLKPGEVVSLKRWT